jgi:hypothetical protein
MNFRIFNAVCTVFCSETSVVKDECMFWLHVRESGFPTVKMLKSKYGSSLVDNVRVTMRTAVTRYTPNYR